MTVVLTPPLSLDAEEHSSSLSLRGGVLSAAFSAALIAGALSSPLPSAPVKVTRQIISATSFGQVSWLRSASADIDDAQTSLSAASLVNQIHDLSGLTWDQIARVFGVSRRSVHQWAAGGRLSAANQEHLALVHKAISDLSGVTPAERSQELLAQRRQGSIFDRLSKSKPTDEVIQAPVSALSAKTDSVPLDA